MPTLGQSNVALENATTASDSIDLRHIQWRMPEWIAANGGLLNYHNALAYFMLSPFYDKSCNNEILRMQSQFNQLGDLSGLLSQMTGIEYTLLQPKNEELNSTSPEAFKQFNAPPSVFVVQKQTRSSPTEVQPIATYFILGPNIYASPSLYTILKSRLVNCCALLQDALNSVSQQVSWSVDKGYNYKRESQPFDTMNPSKSTSNSNQTEIFPQLFANAFMKSIQKNNK